MRFILLPLEGCSVAEFYLWTLNKLEQRWTFYLAPLMAMVPSPLFFRGAAIQTAHRRKGDLHLLLAPNRFP